MARRSRKLPAMDDLAAYLVNLGGYLKSGDEKPISLVTIDWQKIEQAYGQPLSADVRQGLVTAATSFVLFEGSERKGSPIGDVQTTIETCRSHASEFQRGLPSIESVRGSYAQLLISKNFNNPPLGDRLFEILHNLLTSFDVACNTALKELSESPSYKKEGDAWVSWIRRLNGIMENNGLPADVRKDAGNKSKSDKHSPFTLLVGELQYCLPVKARRHTHSPGALATAISRALGSNKLVAPSE
jgi:hypothetical protein